MTLADETQLARWDELIAGNPDGGNSLQTLAWGDFKGRWDWQPRRYVYEVSGRHVAVQFLSRRFPLWGEVWYAPKGPGVTTLADFTEIVRQTKAANLPATFVRFEPEIPDDDVDQAELTSLGLVKANRDHASKSTVFVDLAGGEEQVLASFNQSARRNIRKAAAGGVEITPVASDDANLGIMFELMKATEGRAHYGLRPEAYFKDYWSAQTAAGQAQLFLAMHEGDVLAGLFATFVGQRAWYKDGGSFDVKRELNASYLIQWEVMRWLIGQGIRQYDLVGVPNRDQIGTGDARDGLYSFKRKFNEEITEFIGCWDLPLSGKYRWWVPVGERLAGRYAMKRPARFLY